MANGGNITSLAGVKKMPPASNSTWQTEKNREMDASSDPNPDPDLHSIVIGETLLGVQFSLLGVRKLQLHPLSEFFQHIFPCNERGVHLG